MEEFDLGPNGGLVYCMEYLLSNFSWLEDKLKQLGSQYVLFDCPGQVSTPSLYHTFTLQLSLQEALSFFYLIFSFNKTA